MTTQLKVGDTVSCKIKESTIVSPYSTFDTVWTFLIIGVDTEYHGYYLFIPHYQILKDSVVATYSKCRSAQIDKKYLDENIIYISSHLVVSIITQNEGMNCNLCKEFVKFAEINQNDKFICYGCRKNPYNFTTKV
jgi:hypothetical protein